MCFSIIVPRFGYTGSCCWACLGNGWGMRHLAASTGAALVDALALANVDGGLVVDSCVAHALLDLASHGQECLLDVGGVLGRGLEEGDAD